MAARMKVECSPLPMGRQEDEIRIFSKYMALHPKITAATWRELSKVFS